MRVDGSVLREFSAHLLSRHHSRAGLRAVAALVLALAGLAWPGVARADSGDESSDDVEPAVKPSRGSRWAHAPAEILARAGYADYRVILMQVGIEGMYMMTPHLGFGGAMDAFGVDNGADPYYSSAGTLHTGFHFLALAEADLLDYWVTPYVRLGLGVGQYERYQNDGQSSYSWTVSETEFVGQLAAGLALRGGPLLLRVWAAPSLYGQDLLAVYGAGIGGRF